MSKFSWRVFAGLLTMSAAAFGQVTYGPGPGGAIPDATTTNVTPGVFTSMISIAGAPPTISSLNSATLTFNPLHTFAGDIEAQLTAPNGENVHLFSRVRGTGSTTFGDASDLLGPYTFLNAGASFDAAAVAAGATVAIPSGMYQRSTTPAGTPAPPADADAFTIFAGDNINGNWTLTLRDWGAVDTGGLLNWTLNITSVPEPGSATLLALAAAAAAAFARRRRR